MKITLTDAITQAVDFSIQQLHTCLPATIVDYDYATQKASVLPSIKITFYDGAVVSHPILQNVPLVFPRSGGASLTFPVNKGDGVLVLFSERSLERWLASTGEEVEQGVNRRFDLTDAIAIPGLNSIVTNSLGNSTDVKLVFKTASVTIDPLGNIILDNGNCAIRLKADGTFEFSNTEESLLNILRDTLTAITDITVDASPIENIAAFESLKTRLEKLI
jgi:hypothetical protein